MDSSSKIEMAIDDIEEYLDHCKPTTLNRNKIIVDKDIIDSLLLDLRKKAPEEIKHYNKMLSQQKQIIQDAKNEAEAMINDAAVQTSELINEQEVMRQAYEQAEEVIRMATEQAQEILDQAADEANQYRSAAVAYTDQILANIEGILRHSIEISNERYNNLNRSLTECYNTVVANRTELYPAEIDTSEEVFGDEAEG